MESPDATSGAGTPTFLITNNSNNHSPETWAATTAKMLIDANPDAPDGPAALKLQGEFREMLARSYKKIQDDEQKRLEENAEKQFYEQHDVRYYVDDAFVKLRILSVGTPWESMFMLNREFANQVEFLLGTHFSTSQSVQRQAHARNTDDSAGRAFLDSIHGYKE